MDKTKTEKILQYIKQEQYRNHFFKKLSETKNPIPWLEALKKEGYLSPENNPKPIEDKDRTGFYSMPRWDILGFLENVSGYNKENPDANVTKILLDIINDFIEYQNDQKKRINNYITDWVFMKIISNLPIDKLSSEHIDFIKIALNSKWDTSLIQSDIGRTLLPSLLDNQAKEFILRLLKIIIDFYGKRESGQHEYWFSDLIKKNKEKLIKLCKEDLAKIIIEKIEVVIKEDKKAFNIVWIPTIEDHRQTSFLDEYECQLVRLLRDSLETLSIKVTEPIIKELLGKEHAIFRRIALYEINVRYDELKDLFWNLEINPLENYELTHEIYELLKTNSTKFTDIENNRIIEWIEKKDYYIPEDIKGNEEKKKQLIAYRKKEIYSALLNSPNNKIKEKYWEYDKINTAKLEHPGFMTWSETFVGEKAPDELDEILTMQNKEIADYLKGFTEEKDPRKPSKRGVADKLSNAVFENAEKFSKELVPFLEVDEIYQHAILIGFKDACKKKKTFDWENVLILIYKIVEKNEFWEKKYNDFNYRDWVVSESASLIGEGVKEDNYSFGISLVDKAKEILLMLGDKTTAELFKSDDIITDVLNSVKGTIYSTMIWLSFKIAKTIKKEEADKWDSDIKQFFTKNLDMPSDELLVVIGEYLPYINSLDKKWLNENLDLIFDKNDEEKWKSSMSGYLFYCSMLYKDIYLKLVSHNDYEKALITQLKSKSADQKLVQHVCVAYLHNIEDISKKDSLISKLLNNKNPEQIEEIIRFFWSMRKEELDKSVKSKIKPLWKELFNVLLTEKDNKIFSELIFKLSEWIFLIDEIDDEIFNYLKESVKYVDKPYETWFFIEGLSEHVSKTPKYVGEVLLELLNRKIYPDYKQEYIANIVSNLFQKGQKELANRICNIYLSKGFYFLKEIYKTHNK